ncbi:hypothetical protein RRG08_027900 [Elysia crispata]|uniref:Uncharacterized protein n=1 Tax=Elysia crispata TaxID=231223 RepID=A0AAE1A903_9GAST|nr:hypothetical protein RRG08_027900 [Elysia crispata]
MKLSRPTDERGVNFQRSHSVSYPLGPREWNKKSGVSQKWLGELYLKRCLTLIVCARQIHHFLVSPSCSE